MPRIMTPRFWSTIAGMIAMIPAAARAQDSLDDLSSTTVASSIAEDSAPSGSDQVDAKSRSGKATAEVNGYVSQRLAYQHIRPRVPVSTVDTPSLAEFAEVNIQLKVELGSKALFAYADLSYVYQGGWLFYADDGSGGRTSVPDHDVPALRPYVVPSELYLSWSPRHWMNVLVGKKRITWGAGFAFNPTDLVNPPKDPTDPNYQRAGNWLARVEFPFEKFTLSALFAPQALYTQSGIPYAFVEYPTYAPTGSADVRDGNSHYLLAGRLYALLGNADINLMYYFSNHYQDAFANKSRLGLSFSRYFFTDHEIHIEALLTRGSSRSFPIHACAEDVTACASATSMAASKTEDGTFYPRFILGTRRQFADDSQLSFEYYFQGDGYSDGEFADTVKLKAYAKNESSIATTQTASDNALPQRYTFDPLRRHYLIASYTKPRIFDDWTVSVVLIAGLRDLSGLLSPSVTWSAREWLTLGAYGYIPIHGLGLGEVQAANDNWSEYALSTYAFRVLFEARAYY